MSTAKTPTIKTVPFQGGAVTSKEKVLLPHGSFSEIQNMRPRHPGLEQRTGQVEHCTTGDASTEVMTVYQFNKGHRTERRLFRQLVNGSVQEATDNPPAVTSGVFGTDVLAAVTSAIPASWSTTNDKLLFSDGKRQHQIYLGDEVPVKAFIIYKSATATPVIPQNGLDYSTEVADGQTSTVAVLDAFRTNTNDTIYIMTSVPAKELNIIVSKVNGNASTLSGKYWNGTWANSSITDGTKTGGNTTFGQSGSITWTPPSDEIPHYQFGRSGFWYKLNASAALDAEVELSSVTYDTGWQSILNLWDGVTPFAIEAQIYDNTQLKYSIFGGDSVDLNKMDTDDFGYFSTFDPIAGFYLDPGATANITKAVVVGSSNITFFDGGDGDDYVKTQDADFLEAGFEPGQSVTVSGTTNNNWTAQILRLNGNTIWVRTGTTTEEANQSATITFGADTTALDLVEYWDGDSWTTVGGTLDDGTDGLTKAGFVTWNRNAITPQPVQFNESSYYAYWYRFSFDKQLSKTVNVSIQTLPYFDISELGLGYSNTVWKDRGVYTFDLFGQYLYLSGKDNPIELNGLDFGILEAGDGRSNKIRNMKRFHNELIVWQEEKGDEGGCTTLFEGHSPVTFGKLLLSSRVGIMNAKCAAVVEGVLTSTATDEKISTLVFWLSRYGVMASDGRNIWVISDDIQNYFDPTKSESIRAGYEDKMWLAHDVAYNGIRVGIVSGSSATLPNVFFFLDLVEFGWSTDTLGQPLSCMTNVEAASGNIAVLQVGGGASSGKTYRLNTTDNDVSTAIDSLVTIELDGEGQWLYLKDYKLRCKVQAAGNITHTLAKDANTSYTDSRTLAMQAEVTNDAYRRHDKIRPNKKANHISHRLRNSTASQSMYLLDIGYDLEYWENR